MITVQLQESKSDRGSTVRPQIIIGLKSTKTNLNPAALYLISAHIATRTHTKTGHGYTYSDEAIWTHTTKPIYCPNILEIFETHKDEILAACESLIC